MQLGLAVGFTISGWRDLECRDLNARVSGVGFRVSGKDGCLADSEGVCVAGSAQFVDVLVRRNLLKGNSNSHGARPVHLIITMIKWIRTSNLFIVHSLFECRRQGTRGTFRSGEISCYQTLETHSFVLKVVRWLILVQLLKIPHGKGCNSQNFWRVSWVPHGGVRPFHQKSSS